MFTMKKLAVLAVAGFAAASMFACSDDGGDDETSSSSAASSSSVGVVIGSGWDATGTIILGGSTSTDLGSFVDLDSKPFQVYKLGDAKTNKDKVDLIFDGANLLTPEACDAASFCKDVNNENYVGIMVIPAEAKITASSSAQDVATYFDGFAYDGDDLNEALIKTKVAATAGGKYFVVSMGPDGETPTIAFVVVDGAVSAASITLIIGRSAISLE